jgi:hypothetical protein
MRIIKRLSPFYLLIIANIQSALDTLSAYCIFRNNLIMINLIEEEEKYHTFIVCKTKSIEIG